MNLPEFLVARAEDDEREAFAVLDYEDPKWSRIVAQGDVVRVVVDRFRTAGPTELPGLLFALQVMSTVHADHPDYVESWRPWT